MQPVFSFKTDVTRQTYLSAAKAIFSETSRRLRIFYAVFAVLVLAAGAGMVAVMAVLSEVLGAATGVVFFAAELYLLFCFFYFVVLAIWGDEPKRRAEFGRISRYHGKKEIQLTAQFFEDNITLSTPLVSAVYKYKNIKYAAIDDEGVLMLLGDEAGMRPALLSIPGQGTEPEVLEALGDFIEQAMQSGQPETCAAQQTECSEENEKEL